MVVWEGLPSKSGPFKESAKREKLLLNRVSSLKLVLVLEMSLIPMGLIAKSARSDFTKNFFSRKVFEVLKISQSVATLIHFRE